MSSPVTAPVIATRPAVTRAAAALTALRTRIAAQHAAAAAGPQTCGLATDLFDAVVRDVWESLVAELPAADAAEVRRHVSLVAHGGYGRREMAPYSDIDLMLLHDGAGARVIGLVAKQLLQDLFDAGLDVGQSVRSVNDACRLAAGDATILSGLLDARLLAGQEEPLRRLAARLRSAVLRRPRGVAERLVAARREEADKFGQTVALLEPNVKRSPGGLRDIQLIRWLGRVLHDSETLDELALAGGISRPDADAVRDAQDFLMRVRNDLHLAAGKPADDLTRDQQLRIAQARGIESREGLLGVERFMRDYFGHTRRVVQALETMLLAVRRPHPALTLATGILGHRVDGVFRVGPRDVAALPGCLPQVTDSATSIIRLVELSMLYDLPIAHATWQAVRAAAPTLPREADAATKQAFLALFTHPDGLAPALRRLHEVGVLEIVIPQFVHARHLLQFNNYHKYTVD